MFKWNVEDMVLMNNNYMAGRTKYYTGEADVSREDKIAFVDSMQDGKLSYILSLIEKFNTDKETLSKDSYGNVRTVSLKAWVKKNDTKYSRPIINYEYAYGTYHILGINRSIQTPCKGTWDTFDDLVDEAFHRQLLTCEKMEQDYFAAHDEYSILKKKLRDRDYGTTFGVNLCYWSDGRITIKAEPGSDLERDITIDELKELLSKYDRLDALVEKITAETHIVY